MKKPRNWDVKKGATITQMSFMQIFSIITSGKLFPVYLREINLTTFCSECDIGRNKPWI